MLKEDLRDELIAVRNYGKHIAEATDPEVKAKLTEIQSEERHHADELMGLLSRSGVQDAVFDAEWEENKHPRRKNGQFGRGGESASSRAEMRRRLRESAPTVNRVFSQKSARRELRQGMKERMRSLFTGESEEQIVERAQQRLNNPAYLAGSSEFRDLAIRAGVIQANPEPAEVKHDKKKIGPLKAQIGVDYDKDLDTATKQMFGRKVSKEDVVKLAGGFNEMVKEFLVTADPFSNTISVTANWDANNPVQKMQRTIRKDSIYMDLFMLNNAFKGQNIAPRMLYQSAVMAHKMGIPSIETHAAGNARSTIFNGYYTWARCGYDDELEPAHKRDLGRSVAEGLCTQAEWNNTFSKYTHVSQFMTTKQGRDMWKQHGSDLYHARFDTRPGSKSMKVLKAYLRECGVEI